MSYPWKKSNRTLPNGSYVSKESPEVLDLSDNKLSDKFDDQLSMNSDISIVSTHDIEEDDSKNGDIADSDQTRPGKRNPKCARCANHVRQPIAVKGHKRKCPYKDCVCRLCNLTVERRELMAKTIREKRKQKEDLADNSYIYNEPVFKKHRTDENSSEADRESGYQTEENEKSKPNDHELNEELIKHVNQLVPNIWNQLSQKLHFLEVGQTLLGLYLKDNICSIINQKLSAESITDQIIEASKQIKIIGLDLSRPPIHKPLSPLTPTIPSTLMSPPSSASSNGSPDTPNDSFRTDTNMLRNLSLPLPFPPINPFQYSQLINQFGSKHHGQWTNPPITPFFELRH